MSCKNVWSLVSLGFVLAITGGCGSSGTSSPPPPPPAKAEFLYLTTFQPPPANAVQLVKFKLDSATGVLDAKATTDLSFFAGGIAVDPASHFLYVSDPNPVTPAINIFSISPTTGSLSADGAFVLTTICPFCSPVNGPGALAMDSKGKLLYYGSDDVGVSQVIGGLSVTPATGALNLVSGSPFPADDMPYAVILHPSGKFLYTENTSGNSFLLQSISGFSVDPSSGALTPLPGSPFAPPANAQLPGFAMHPSGKFLYASTANTGNGILGWSVDATNGALTVLPASPFAPVTMPFGMTFAPSGKFVYASNPLGGGGILGFTIDAGSGTLTSITGSPFDPGVILGDCIVDPSGKFLLASDGKNQAIDVFSIDSSTGALTSTGSPTPLGAFAFSMVMAKAPQ